jgi:hypothetical protein
MLTMNLEEWKWLSQLVGYHFTGTVDSTQSIANSCVGEFKPDRLDRVIAGVQIGLPRATRRESVTLNAI